MATAIDTPQSPGSRLMPALDRATVADAMRPGILSCEPEMSLSAVARMMASDHVHCLVVLGVTGRRTAIRSSGEFSPISTFSTAPCWRVGGRRPTRLRAKQCTPSIRRCRFEPLAV